MGWNEHAEQSDRPLGLDPNNEIRQDG